MTQLSDRLFSVSPAIRYVATLRSGELALSQRPGLQGASASETDRYEELLVNPTLLELAGRRGDLDCGGLEFLLVRYGSFFQFVERLPDGHVSVAIDASADVLAVVAAVREATAAG